jgi:hypothetical protein
VPSEESLNRKTPGSIDVPVPVGSSSGNAEVDYIGLIVHASLKNWNPQMNSRMLKMPKSPGLVRSQKLVFLLDLEEKATCWKVMRAMNPVKKMRKMKI